MNLDSGTISPLGMSHHAEILHDRSSLEFFEEPLAEITVDVTPSQYTIGWIVFNRRSSTFWAVLPLTGKGRVTQAMEPEFAMDLLAEIWSMEYH